MEERRYDRHVPHQGSPTRENHPQKPKRWLAHQGHDRPDDRKGPHFHVAPGPNR